MRATLQGIKGWLRLHMHDAITDQGRWLRTLDQTADAVVTRG
jgi:hypothetical protein